MFKSIAAVAVATVAALTFATPVLAAPVASFTMTPAQVGVPVTFDADGGTNCYTNRCQWSWDYVSGGAYKTGGQIGEGQHVIYTFGAYAASKAYVVVKLKVTAPGGTANFTLAARAVVVAP